MGLPISFSWPVCPDGYEVLEAVPLGGDGVLGRFVAPVSTERRLRHFPQPQLSCFLLQLPKPAPAQILTLASQLGLLSGGQALQCVDDGRLTQRLGEPLALWQNLAADLSHALLTWRMAGVANWEEWDAFFYQGRRQPPSRPGSSEDLADLKQGSAQLAAARAAERLGNRLAVKIEPAQQPSALFCPRTMQDYLWLELALGIASSSQPTPCQSCDAWYLTSTGQSRTDKRYCSDACRMRAYRARRKAA